MKGIEKIIEAYKNKESIDNFSRVIDIKNFIKELNFDLLVEKYVAKKQIQNIAEISASDINAKLKDIDENLKNFTEQQNTLSAKLNNYKLHYYEKDNSIINTSKSLIFQQLGEIIKVKNRAKIELSNYVDVKYGLLTPSNEQAMNKI